MVGRFITELIIFCFLLENFNYWFSLFTRHWLIHIVYLFLALYFLMLTFQREDSCILEKDIFLCFFCCKIGQRLREDLYIKEVEKEFTTARIYKYCCSLKTILFSSLSVIFWPQGLNLTNVFSPSQNIGHESLLSSTFSEVACFNHIVCFQKHSLLGLALGLQWSSQEFHQALSFTEENLRVLPCMAFLASGSTSCWFDSRIGENLRAWCK